MFSILEFGLSNLIEMGYFNSAFPLHNCTGDKEMNKKYNDLLIDHRVFKNAHERDYFRKCLQQKSFVNNDLRSSLNTEWASFKKIFKYQPMEKIRSYFGEEIGLYFAWAGTLVTTLWFPSLIGLIFFFIGFDSS